MERSFANTCDPIRYRDTRERRAAIEGVWTDIRDRVGDRDANKVSATSKAIGRDTGDRDSIDRRGNNRSGRRRVAVGNRYASGRGGIREDSKCPRCGLRCFYGNRDQRNRQHWRANRNGTKRKARFQRLTTEYA